MTSYRIDRETAIAQREAYKKCYPPFVPRRLSQSEQQQIASELSRLLSAQNGQDLDDYKILDDNHVERYLSRYVDKEVSKKVLFLGTGSGRELIVGAEMGFDCWGVTLGSRNIGFSEFIGVPVDRMFECFNEALPFMDEAFDIVFAAKVFEHCISPSLFLSSCNRVLIPGGRLILEWPISDKQTGDSNPHHQLCCTPGQARGLAQKNGFTDISLHYSNLELVPEDIFWDGNSENHKPSRHYEGLINFVLLAVKDY